MPPESTEAQPSSSNRRRLEAVYAPMSYAQRKFAKKVDNNPSKALNIHPEDVRDIISHEIPHDVTKNASVSVIYG